MRCYPSMALHGDLGYWDELRCDIATSDRWPSAREQLQQAMKSAIPGTQETVVDRVMFATDWLMLSQVRGWADCPRRVRESLSTIPDISDAELAKVFGGNARNCFRLNRPPRPEEGHHGE